jgi:hypothetical protein
MVVRLSALRTGRALLSRNNFSAYDADFCYTLSKSQGLVRMEGFGKLGKTINIFGNQHSEKIKS